MKKVFFLMAFFFTAFADIPTKLHFIWIGPKELSKESKVNIETWQKNHPDYNGDDLFGKF
jgi:mannosyltransferase OCH1-like enzyme